MDTLSPQVDTLFFEKLALNDASIEDIMWIKIGMATLHSGLGLREVFIDMERNALLLYRITGENSQGIIMFKITVWPTTKEMSLYMMAGEGLLKTSAFDQIWEYSRSLARQSNCKWLSTTTPIPTLAKLYTRRFGAPASTTFREEL